ncbi:MAG TPA: ATPase, partial [Pseudonocardia sp.]|nr:ATPase [Pseudonocardia sp.]
HRLAELDRELAATRPGPDPERARRLERERAALGAEVERAAGLGGRSRPLGASTVERARKAVTARIRDAVRRIGAAHPELGAHLDRSVITGTSCRYDPVDPLVWTLSEPLRAR